MLSSLAYVVSSWSIEYDGKPGIDKKDIAEFNKRYKGHGAVPSKAPAKFRGRTLHHAGAGRHANPLHRPDVRVAVMPAEAVAIGLTSPGRSHRG